MPKKEKTDKSVFEENPIDYYKFFSLLWKYKKYILSLTFIIVFVSIIISYLLTPIYRAQTTILPIASRTDYDNALSGIMQIPVLSVSGITDDTRRIMIMLDSKSIKKNLLQKREDVRKKFNVNMEQRDSLNNAIVSIDNITSVSANKETGLISISVDHSDPVFARDLANYYVDELQNMLTENSLHVSKIKMKIIEDQLKDSESSYKQQQEELVKFQKETKMMRPMMEGKGTMDIYTNLLSQKATLEIKLKSIEAALTPQSPQIRALRSQIGVINSKIKSIEEEATIGELPSLKDAPDKLAKYSNLIRDMQITETIYNTLLKLYEQTKLEMAREFLFIQVIDEADIPQDRINFTRKHIVYYSGFGSFLLGIFLILFAEWLKRFDVYILDPDWIKKNILKRG